MRRIHQTVGAAILLMMTTSGYMAAADASRAEIRFPKTGARTWTFDNGFELIVEEDRSAPVASIQAWCRTGSIDEGEWMGAGLSHILEHMLFKGTETRSTNEIAQSIQDAGGYINAYTSYDRTVYWIDIPADGVMAAIDVLADAMLNSTLPVEEYDKEQEVIRREFAMGFDDPDRMAHHQLFGTAYSVHPYKHPVIGHLDIYNRLTRDDVLAYYKARYVPNNLFFVISGDVDAEAIHARLAETIGKAPRRALPPVYIPTEPPQLGRRDDHREFATELTRLSMSWHIPAVTHPDTPALDLLAIVLGNGRSSRLYRELRDGKALVHSISSWAYTPRDPGVFAVTAVLDPEHREAVEGEVLAQIERIKEHPVSEAELVKARNLALSGQLEGMTTARGRASDLGSNWLLARNLDFTREYLEALQRVTPADLQRVAREYLVDRTLTVTSLNPGESLVKSDASPKVAAAPEIQKFTLSNGVRLLVREDRRLPLVSMTAVFRGGLLSETAEDNGITRLLSKTLLKGTKSRSAEEIATLLESVGGGIESESGNNSFSVSVSVLKPDLGLGIDVLGDVLLSPAFPEAEVAREKESLLAAIKNEEDEMTSVARNLLRSKLFAGHPYGLRALGTPESVAALTPERLRAFHAKQVRGANCAVAVFGDVDAGEVRELVERAFGGMGRGAVDEGRPAAAAPLAGDMEAEAIKNKAQAILMVGFRGAELDSEDRPALELIDEASSDLGSRFFVRIREQMGLAYFVGSSQFLGLAPGAFIFYLGTDPAKLEPVRKELLDEISKLAREGLTQEEVDRAKKKWIGQQEIRGQSNAALASAAALNELYGLGYDYDERLIEKIRAVDAAEIRRVAAKYFADQPKVVAQVRPPVEQAKK